MNVSSVDLCAAQDRQSSSALPLVSVLTFCRNGALTLRRCVESVVHQSYPNIHYVIQDAASTDRTLAIVEEYGDRIDLVSEPDEGANDGFFRGLLRCKGDIIVVCSADEALMPCAVERAVQEFAADPDLGAVTGDGYYWNVEGNVFHTQAPGEFNLLSYLLGTYCPNFSASFFRRSALEGVGFFANRWRSGRLESIEFEIWCRLGTDHKIKYVPYIFSKYGVNDEQLSHNLSRVIDELNARTMIINTFLFSRDGFFGSDTELRTIVLERQYGIIIRHLSGQGRRGDALRIEELMRDEIGSAPNRKLARFMSEAVVTETDRLGSLRLADKIVFGLRRITPRRIAAGMSLELKQKVRSRLQQLSLVGFGMLGKSLRRFKPAGNLVSIGTVLEAQLYHRVAELYRWRGQVEEAWSLWQRTEILRNEIIASDGCQVVLKSPYRTDADLAEIQRKWADIYAQPNLAKVRHTFPKRHPSERLTIGYYCSFWHGEGIRAHALSFIEKHDRSTFKVVGYSPYDVPQVAPAFETFKYVGSMSNDDFVDLVREDGVDIFIDLSGMSDRHRLGAMASRCAAVQISYINHPAPLCVPNVDYLIADAIAAPPCSDIHYPEEIYRLPRNWFCSDFTGSEMPSVAPPPHLANGHVTFGFFGGTEKLNTECIKLWAKVLRAIPNARLVMQGKGFTAPSDRDFFLKKFGWFGVDATRLTLLPAGPRAEVIGNYARVDISLDTWPYCGGNTIAESIHQGVPVISLCGDRFASAYGAAHITACGLSDLVAHSPVDFVAIAVALSRDSPRLVALRTELRAMAFQHGFSDSRKFCRDIEAAYKDMYTRRSASL